MLLDTKILSTLGKLDLTYYGAKVYATLVATGTSTATVSSAESGFPRTKVYNELKRLEQEKWVAQIC